MSSPWGYAITDIIVYFARRAPKRQASPLELGRSLPQRSNPLPCPTFARSLVDLSKLGNLLIAGSPLRVVRRLEIAARTGLVNGAIVVQSQKEQILEGTASGQLFRDALPKRGRNGILLPDAHVSYVPRSCDDRRRSVFVVPCPSS